MFSLPFFIRLLLLLIPFVVLIPAAETQSSKGTGSARSAASDVATTSDATICVSQRGRLHMLLLLLQETFVLGHFSLGLSFANLFGSWPFHGCHLFIQLPCLFFYLTSPLLLSHSLPESF